MRKKFLSIILVLVIISCENKSEKKFEITGNVKNVTAKNIYLEEVSLINMQPLIVDSAQIKEDGSFTLTTQTKEESLYTLRLDRSQYPFVTLINDSKNIDIQADLQSAEPYKVKGSEASTQLKDYLTTSGMKINSIIDLTQQTDSLSRIKSDSVAAVRSSERVNKIQELKEYSVGIAQSTKSPALAIFVLGSFQSLASNPQLGITGFTNEEVNDLITKTANRFPKHAALASLKSMVAQAQQQQNTTTLINKPAPDFTLPDVNGNPVNLNSLRGKYVLVDFWASWCKPCRQENPNVVNAYKQFKDKNFTILGVSLDQEKNAWIQAIKQDNLTWQHVSDLQFWSSKVVPLYNIESIPYNVLLDPNGVVIAERLTGPALSNKLMQVLK